MKSNVVLIILEGPSDEDTLAPWIETELRKLNKALTVKVVHGDLLTKFIPGQRNIFNITPSIVKGEITKFITRSIKVPFKAISWKDILKIYYITDTDNCFIKSDITSINKSECLKSMFYIIILIWMNSQKSKNQ